MRVGNTGVGFGPAIRRPTCDLIREWLYSEKSIHIFERGYVMPGPFLAAVNEYGGPSHSGDFTYLIGMLCLEGWLRGLAPGGKIRGLLPPRGEGPVARWLSNGPGERTSPMTAVPGSTPRGRPTAIMSKNICPPFTLALGARDAGTSRGRRREGRPSRATRGRAEWLTKAAVFPPERKETEPMDMRDKPVEATATTAKKAYTTPRLEDLGRMQQVTRATVHNVENAGEALELIRLVGLLPFPPSPSGPGTPGHPRATAEVGPLAAPGSSRVAHKAAVFPRTGGSLELPFFPERKEIDPNGHAGTSRLRAWRRRRRRLMRRRGWRASARCGRSLTGAPPNVDNGMSA